jgi:hypothetical protein
MEPRIDSIEAKNEVGKGISAEEAENNCKILEKKMDSQRAVFRYMVPTVFQGYLANDPDTITNSAEEDIFLRWHNKYSKLFGDYFTELMTNDDEAGKESRNRILAGKPTTEDCLNLKQYLEDPAHIRKDEEGNNVGGSFLVDENEIGELREAYRRSVN